MDSLGYLFAAYAIIWLIIFAYSYSISSRQRALWREIQALKEVVEEERATSGAKPASSRESSFAEIEG